MSELSDLHTDVSKGKRADTSQDAFARGKETRVRDRVRVLEYIRSCGENGATLHDICSDLGKEKNCLSGRITELHGLSVIYNTGKRRDNCRVYRALSSLTKGNQNG
jgi:hypothetical protein